MNSLCIKLNEEMSVAGGRIRTGIIIKHILLYHYNYIMVIIACLYISGKDTNDQNEIESIVPESEFISAS